MNILEFKKDLKKLLFKYNCSIRFECDECSDLNGLYGEKMIAYHNGSGKTITLNCGYNVADFDI